VFGDDEHADYGQMSDSSIACSRRAQGKASV
jgi:hypothetical protein